MHNALPPTMASRQPKAAQAGFGQAVLLAIAFNLAATNSVLANDPMERVSVKGDGSQFPRDSCCPSISVGGRFVTFDSDARLQSIDKNDFGDIYRHDRKNNATILVSIGPGGKPANNFSTDSAVSPGGRYIVFQSAASNLIAGDTNGQIDVFVHDRHRRKIDRASVATGGVEGNGGSGEASISGGGRFIVFASSASNLTPNDSNGSQDIFIRDRKLNVTERVNVANNGVQANGFSFHPSVSRNGRHVAFTSTATNLVPGDLNGKTDVFVRDRWNKTTTIVSSTASGVQGDDFSTDPAISADGKFVVFTSFSTNFVVSDNNGAEDIFVKDLLRGRLIRVNIGPAGLESNDRSGEPSISGDGRLVSFSSNATNLVADDTNQRSDVFVHDRKNEITFRVSSGRDGTQGDGNVGDSSMSADGRFVAFGSLATNLVPNDTNNAQDVFVYRLR